MEDSKGSNLKLLVAYGTRPEFIKIKPILNELDKRGLSYKLVQVAQHTDLIEQIFDQKVDVFDYKGLNRLDCIVKSVLAASYIFEDVTHVLVQGDTTTSMSVALAAFHREIPIIHLEAGLRTFDQKNPYPEEANRRIISALASVHLCPTAYDQQNLTRERYEGNSLHITGNTVIDNIVGIPTSKNNEVLVTLHRRENHKDIRQWFKAIEALAVEFSQYKFIFPMHPNPNIQKHKEVFKTVNVCEPFSYNEMKDRLANCELVISDSGGIQEECSYFKKVCLVCRTATERPSYSSILCPSPKDLTNNFRMYRAFSVDESSPFGDGNAAQKITDVIENL